jgi:hypothetical protein
MARSGSALRRSNATPQKKIDTDKVGKLVRLLASDKEGEVLAAVAALKRTLGAGGADINDMADAVETGFKPKRQQPTRWTPPAPDPDYWESLAWYAHFHRHHLATSDKDYVYDVLLGQHFDCGHADAAMMARLRSIVAKVEAARDADWW